MSNLGRIRVREDRFYSPPAMRRYNQQQQKQVQQEEQKVQSQRQQEKQQQSEALMSSSRNDVTTNLDRFMKHTTPIVAAQHLPKVPNAEVCASRIRGVAQVQQDKTSMKGWRNQENGCHPYFILGDLWESLKEWSAYGAGVPLVLNESDSVVQYYVPYLSAIQLYVDPSTPVTSIRRPGEESDSGSSRATSSDGSYEPHVEENNVGSITKSFNNIMLRGGDSFVGNGGTEEGEIRNPPGLLIFEYFERALPYHRAPLADKISDLASKFPELKTYRSCDLTRASWVSVAWYPIYRIPVGPSLQNLDASFLTYHSLSTPLKNMDGDKPSHQGSTVFKVDDVGTPCRLTLPIFGLAAYKFKNSDWTESGVHGAEKVGSLMNSTENWLRSRNVYHPDFVFFKNHDFRR